MVSGTGIYIAQCGKDRGRITFDPERQCILISILNTVSPSMLYISASRPQKLLISVMIFSTILSVWILFAHVITANLINLPKRDILVERTASDACCKSCAPIGKALTDCPITTSDIFCRCDPWVKSAPTCETCIVNALFNTTFAVNPGPTLEIFWAFCQCQGKCRNIATALFAPQPCNFGQDNLCASQHLVSDGPECLHCIKHVDPWMASWFKLEIELAADFVKTGVSAIPGSFLNPAD